MNDYDERMAKRHSNLKYVKTIAMIGFIAGLGWFVWNEFFTPKPVEILLEVEYWMYENQAAIQTIESKYGVKVESKHVPGVFSQLIVTPVEDVNSAAVLMATAELSELHPPVDIRGETR